MGLDSPDTATTGDSVPPMGRRYQVGGRGLVLHRSGEQGPTVVFMPGAGLVGLDFLNIHDRVAEIGTSVLYDRAGTGWSDQADLPRSAAEVTTELHDLLRAADVPGPYLLVGHSMSGVFARHYAQRFPDEVSGLLLLDPYHEDNPSRMPQQVMEMQNQMTSGQELPDPPAEAIEFYRRLFTQVLSLWPDGIREQLVEHHIVNWRAGVWEMENLDQLGEEVRGGGAEPDVPLIVLTAMGEDAFRNAVLPEDLERQVSEVKLALHVELVQAAAHGEHRVLDDAGHNWIHVQRPDAVFQAIKDLVDRAN